jgi:hypothetical protein
LHSTDGSRGGAPQDLGPEARLLFLTAGYPRTEPALRGLLEARLDWETVAFLAERENATLVVSRYLRAAGDREVPAAVRTLMQRREMVASFRQLHLEQRLTEVVSALAGAGIDVMLLKGAALGKTVYGSFAERPMGDLDLLVRPQQAEQAQELLCQSGWVLPERHARAVGSGFYRESQHLPPLDDAKGSGIGAELHTGVFQFGHPFCFGPDDLWSEAETVSIDGRTAFVPSPVHQLLHACIHFAWAHMLKFGAWRTFRDVHALVTANRVDWERFVRMADRARATTCCFWTLHLAHVLADIEAPAGVSKAMAPPMADWSLKHLERHFITGLLPPALQCPSVRLQQLLWGAAIRPRRSGHGRARPWSRKAAVRAAFLPPPPSTTDRISWHLKNARLWKNYLAVVLGGRVDSPGA